MANGTQSSEAIDPARINQLQENLHKEFEILIESGTGSWPLPVPELFRNCDKEMQARLDCKRLHMAILKLYELQEKAPWTIELRIAERRSLKGQSFTGMITKAEFLEAQEFISSTIAKSIYPWVYLEMRPIASPHQK